MFIFHPIFFAIFPVLFFYAYNITQIYPKVLYTPIAFSIAFAFIVNKIFFFFLKDKLKSATLTSLFLIIFFSYKNYLIAMEMIIPIGYLKKDIILQCILLLLISTLSLLVLKAKSNLVRLTSILNLIAFTLVSLSIINIIYYESTQRFPFKKRKELYISTPSQIKSNKTNLPKRDIYYLIFDRFANTKVLKKYLNYDNSDFENYLQNKNFYIAKNSRANYPTTFLSLASSLNFNYLDNLSQKIGNKACDETIVYDFIENNAVIDFLKKQNYTISNLGSGWEPTRLNKNADINFSYNPLLLDEFSTKLIKTTVLNIFLKDYLLDVHKARILYQLKKIKEASKLKSPKYVFAHILLPHEPFVFDRSGKKQLKNKNVKEKYVDQLIFTSNEIKSLVEDIIAHSELEPIIIIQSDEGPFIAKEFKAKRGKDINWLELSDEALITHMKIFNAYYLPDSNQNSAYKSITPVNTFRLIFNQYFGTNYPLLPDEVYTFENTKYPYKLVRITKRVD